MVTDTRNSKTIVGLRGAITLRLALSATCTQLRHTMQLRHTRLNADAAKSDRSVWARLVERVREAHAQTALLANAAVKEH